MGSEDRPHSETLKEPRMSWESLEVELKKVADKVRHTQYEPDIIVGIIRGGLVPARILSTMLNVRKMHTLSLKRNEDGTREITAGILEDIRGMRVLLIEDMLETGRGLIQGKQYLSSLGAEVKTACLYVMPISEIEPDFYLKRVNQVQVFPWE